MKKSKKSKTPKALYLCFDESQMRKDLPCLLLDKEYSNRLEYGAECNYYRLSHYFGLKVFEEKSDCSFSIKMQRRFFKCGKGPEVIGKMLPIVFVRINISNGDILPNM
jgi:hypothetical protein